MKKAELQQLIKLEDKINRIAREELNLEYPDFEIDICPPEKFLEIQAYRGPTQISHWSYGKHYDRLKTIFDNVSSSVPYEVVVHSIPPRAYLLSTNPLGIHALVISHVCGHVSFFSNNKYFQMSRKNIVDFMSNACERFASYERKYGIEIVEPVIDAALSLQQHVDPFDIETHEQKLERVFEQTKLKNRPSKSEFSDLEEHIEGPQIDIEALNNHMWMKLKNKIPVEPTGDILKFIAEYSPVISSWEKDIIETLREEGIYYYPIIRTKFANEGFASVVHQKIMDRLFEEKLLDSEAHGLYARAQSLVKTRDPLSLNPYLIGSKIFEDIEDRWNKGKFGKDWESCDNIAEKTQWDLKLDLGWKKCLEVITTYNDWQFMQDFLTVPVVEDLQLYVFEYMKTAIDERIVRRDYSLEDIRNFLVRSLSLNWVPKIEVVNASDSLLVLFHDYIGLELDPKYAEETMKYIRRLWGRAASLTTVMDGKEAILLVD